MFGSPRPGRFDRIAQEVVDAGGVHEVTLEVLRDAYGAARAGCHIRDGIAHELEERAIRFLPGRLPVDQTHVVVLFHTGTVAGGVLAGALELARLQAAVEAQGDAA